MPLETPTWINDFVITNPADTDTANFGDDHLRNIKAALKNTFPSYTHAVGMPTVVNKTGAYSLLAADDRTLFTADATSASFAFALPLASAVWAGYSVSIRKTDATVNTVTINRAGADTIDGATSVVLASQLSRASFISDGVSKWFVYDRGGASATAFEETFSIHNIERTIVEIEGDVNSGFHPYNVQDGFGTIYFARARTFAGIITKFSGRSTSNTVTCSLLVNGVAVTGSSLNASAAGATVTPTATAWAVGDELSMSYSGLRYSCYLTMAYTRILP